ncbi:MAG: hypothetical protein MR006_02720 [Arcanobacterium sp.]|nr:hypothetical protein [Arcanobacterium sp.]MDY5589223.1 hypothetical protein [Arcanobacterium sp.]
MARKSLLILSFSNINADARVLKQVKLFTRDYAVTTACYGEAPEGVEHHIELPPANTLHSVNGRYILLKQYRLAYWRIPAIRQAWERLRGQHFDLAIANDLDAVPIVARLRPQLGFHADLHEFYPALHADDPAWKKYRQPWIEWLCAHYLPQAASTTTVSRGLQRAYREQFGLSTGFVPNATPYAELAPGSVGKTIRIVHSGACLRNRKLDITLEAVQAASAPVTLDLYLTPNDPPFLEYLKRTYASERVTFHDPVPYKDLVATLNKYDVGVHLIAPVNFNNKWALPNKFFDYVQARLGLLIGPSPEMKELAEKYHIGVVAAGFESADLAAAIETLTPERVAELKAASAAAAHELSAEQQVGEWAVALARIARREGCA